MFLSKRPPGGTYYLYFFDSHGKRRCLSTKAKLKTDALKFLQQFKQSDHEHESSLTRISVSEFAATFLAHSRAIHTRKTAESNATALSQFLRVVGDLTLQRITPRDIEVFLATKKEEASVWTARKYYLALSAAFETAKRWGHLASNPFRRVSKPKPPEAQPVFFTLEEFRKLLQAIRDRDFADLVMTAAMTGMRLGELLSLEWTSVDHTRGVITVRNTRTFTTKSKRARVIPMNDELRRLL